MFNSYLFNAFGFPPIFGDATAEATGTGDVIFGFGTVETGADVAVFSMAARVTAALAAVEVGADVAVFGLIPAAQIDVDADEAGADVASFTMAPSSQVFVADGLMSGRLGFALPDSDYLSSGAIVSGISTGTQTLGSAWTRIDVRVQNVYASDGASPNWSAVDTMVNDIVARGARPLMLLGSGGWLGTALDTSTVRNKFAAFAAAAVTRYMDRCKHYEVLNEANYAGRITTGANYSALLAVTTPAMLAVDPDAFVLVGGCAPIPSPGSGGHLGAVEWLTAVYAAGAAPYFHGVAFHPYTQPLTPLSPQSWQGFKIADEIRALMVTSGDSAKPLWLTEFGAPTQGNTNPMSAAGQATVLREAIALTRAKPYYGPLIYYSYKDRGGVSTDSENWFGIVDPSYVAKKASAVFSAAAAQDAATVFPFTFKPNTGNVILNVARFFDSFKDPCRTLLTFALGASRAGLSINAATGDLTIDPVAFGNAPLSSETITVTATRSGYTQAKQIQLTPEYPELVTNWNFNGNVTGFAALGSADAPTYDASSGGLLLNITGTGGGVNCAVGSQAAGTYRIRAKMRRTISSGMTAAGDAYPAARFNIGNGTNLAVTTDFLSVASVEYDREWSHAGGNINPGIQRADTNVGKMIIDYISCQRIA